MPKCKNDPKKSYKGTEPSPKGLGYCAHGEKEGKIRKGKDGNKWIIKKVKNGSKRWMKVSGKVKSKKVDKKIKKKANKVIKKKQGKRGSLEKKGKMYTFDKDFYEGFVIETNPESKMFGKYIKGPLLRYKKYLTHWNGGRPYLCYVKEDKLNNRYDVLIFSQDKGIKLNDKQYGQLITPKGADKFARIYTKYVKNYSAEKVFVGIDSEDRSFSRGNTILLKLPKNKKQPLKLNRYVFIEGEIYEFSTTDEIVKYYSMVGNADVPYPIAVGKENVYFMLDRKYIPLKYFPKKMKARDFEEAYDLFYDYTASGSDEEKEPIAKDAKIFNFKNVKKIHMEA